MNCNRCKAGKMFLDRVFTDNSSFEASCLHCGHREFIGKGSELGLWLTKIEKRRVRAENGLL